MNTHWRVLCLLALSLGIGGIAGAGKAQAQEYYMGQIITVGFTFCPRGTLEANGALQSISQNSALFALLGTNFGGDGISTFGLPDLRGRVAIGQGAGPGLSPVQIGEKAGTENVTLNQTQMPAHTHGAVSQMRTSSQAANTDEPDAANSIGASSIYNSVAPDTVINAATVNTQIQISGNSTPFGIRNPYLGMLNCIVTQGIFPSRP